MKKSILKAIALLSVVVLTLTLYSLSTFKQTEFAHGGRPPVIDTFSIGKSVVAHGGRPPVIDTFSIGKSVVAHGGRPPVIDTFNFPSSIYA